jgi:hypothetical protein
LLRRGRGIDDIQCISELCRRAAGSRP